MIGRADVVFGRRPGEPLGLAAQPIGRGVEGKLLGNRDGRAGGRSCPGANVQAESLKAGPRGGPRVRRADRAAVHAGDRVSAAAGGPLAGRREARFTAGVES